MEPVRFKEANATFAEDQPEYLPLPAHIDRVTPDHAVTTCWKFSFKERLRILFGANLWLQTLTFGQPLQPIKPSIKNPFESK